MEYICFMLKAFRQYVEKEKLFRAGERLLVAVSGGIDSVVLFHLVKESGYDAAIVHCNFGLRGEESDGDEAFVRKLAKESGTPVFVKRCDAAAFAREKKLTIQEAARILRYDYFSELVKESGYSKVALAHNADDFLESFFINLARVTGLKGLTGMPVKRLPFVRPLLFASRKQIESYALKHRIAWREDASNAGDKYLRNRIRHYLIPALKKVQPDFPRSIRRSMDHLAEAEQLFQLLLKEKQGELIHKEDNGIVVDIDPRFYDQGGGILLYYLLKPFGFDRDVVSQLMGAIVAGASGKWFYGRGYRLLLDRKQLILMEKKAQEAKTVWIFRPQGAIADPVKLSFSVKAAAEAEFRRNPNKAWFDLDKLTFPLELRPWRKGDRIVPFGMKQSKLVSDVLINRKISLADKENVYLLLAGNEVLWVVGLKNSACCNVTAATEKVLEVELVQ